MARVYKTGSESTHWNGGKPKCIICDNRLSTYSRSGGRCIDCYRIFMKENPPKRGKSGYKLSEETKRKMAKRMKGNTITLGRKMSIKERMRRKGLTANEKNYQWKGEDAGYRSKHTWVIRYKGKPTACIDCGITNEQTRIHWSNIDHKYRRNLEDYTARCASCHGSYDVQHNLRKHNS